MVEARLLRSFVAVAEELHFGRAAKRLHLSQPPLSLHIQRLEADLGAPLFERSSRRVALTEAGEALLGRARHILAELERARLEVGRVARGDGGTLAVGYTATASHEVLPRVLVAFRRAHPDVALELQELRSALQPAALLEGRIEAGFVCAPLDVQGLDETRVDDEPLFVALPTTHRLSGQRHVDVRALAREDFVLVSPTVEPGWALRCDAALRGAGVHPRVAQTTDGKVAMLGLVAAGLGVSLVSRSLTVLTRRGVVFRPVRGLGVTLRLSLLTKPDASPRARAFRAVVERVMRG
ncbi:MAG: LysR substrate-binding domain-containing protein [Myxococcaceae bacterium]